MSENSVTIPLRPTRRVLHFIGVACALLLLGSCAGAPESRPAEAFARWICDAQSDEAVERGNWFEARLGHEALLEKDPFNCLALYHLGYIWGHLGDREREVLFYEQALDCGYLRDEQLYFNLGMAYADMQRFEEALAVFEQALEFNPRSAESYFGVGLIAAAQGSADLARQALEKAVELAPQHWDARLILARTYISLDQIAAARVQLDAILKHDPDHEEAAELLQLLDSPIPQDFEP